MVREHTGMKAVYSETAPLGYAPRREPRKKTTTKNVGKARREVHRRAPEQRG